MPAPKKMLTVKSDNRPHPKSNPKPKAHRSTKGGDVIVDGISAKSKPTRTKGINSGMKIMDYQDHTLSINHKSNKQLSETALAEDWATEFPRADCMQRRDVKIVGSVRRLYNQGRHTSSQGGVKPDRQSVPYSDEGKPITKAVKGRATKDQTV